MTHWTPQPVEVWWYYKCNLLTCWDSSNPYSKLYAQLVLLCRLRQYAIAYRTQHDDTWTKSRLKLQYWSRVDVVRSSSWRETKTCDTTCTHTNHKPLTYIPQSTHTQAHIIQKHTKQNTLLEPWRHNSLLTHTTLDDSLTLNYCFDQLIRVGPGMGGTPLPLILCSCTQSTVGMPPCLSYREGWMPTLLEEWETGTS